MPVTSPETTPKTAIAETSFSFHQARSLIEGLGQPKAWIYWTDFLASIITGHVAFFLILGLPRQYPNSSWAIAGAALAYVVTILAYMRALMFIHELVHLPKDQFKGFRIAWNALCGIFMFVPSFLYYPHVDHHRRKHYGTEHDGEYLALSHNGRWMIVGFIAQAILIPILGFARFAIISPICWLIPGARKWVHKHASTMLVDPFYERTDVEKKDVMRIVVLQEVLVFAWCVVFATRYYFRTGEWFNPLWVVAYSVGVGLLVLNELRTLGAHRWTNEHGEMSFQDQMLDSVNYPHAPWFSELWGPIGTRYHALHHLFPRLPYHDLGRAHRRLVAGLPADSPYHDTIAPSLTSEIASLWRRAKASESSQSFRDLWARLSVAKSR
ncbi:Fatty acid desaturase [Rubripirellula amarantea]|uniref:Fatty acid desaturase n=1 Tax=Rubripirellula amarantea TaxID=2527999 RepID=A0A5C5WV97_9BACT|nr:fatty acid desaturase [Rubripirellula amarantea]TWT53742.1 Fatty acid desaturase [Rubripirellula amarantea]